MLPHRSDTSRGHLHPPTRPRLSLPPFASLFLSFFPMDVRLELTSRTIAGVVSPVRPLMPPLSWGRLRKLPFPSLPFLPSPRLCNYQDPLATFSSRRIARRCNGHCLRVKSFDPRRNDTPPEVVAWSGRLHDFWELLIVRSRASTMAMCSGRPLHSLGARERRSREICPLAS